MRPTIRLAATLLLALPCAAAAAVRAEEPAPPAPPAAPQDAAAPSELEALHKELEETFVQVRKDWRALTGPGAAAHFTALEEAAAAEAKSRGAAPEGAELADLWVKRNLLGPVVAARLAARLPEAAAKAADKSAPPYRHAAAASKLVFPEATAEDNWDKHFTDLDVVRRWAKARAKAKDAAPAPAPSPDGEAEPPLPAPLAEPDPADMVLVPKGELQVPEKRGRGWEELGQKAEKRTLKPFYIDRTEVTGAAYALFLKGVKDGKLRERILPTGWKYDDKGVPVLPDGAAALPVTGIPYEGAASFAASLGKRLPTEDEWERAARGNAGLRYPWGNEWAEGNAVAAGKAGPAPAGSTAGDRSAFGVLDMAGNVSEFCATYPDGKTVKGLPKPTEQVVRRGGNFRESADEAANDWRYVIGPAARSELVGFRCAMDEKDYERRYGRK